MPKMKIVGLAGGGSTPFDGTYLSEYDPTRPGVAPDGEPMTCHLVCTPNPAEALDLPLAELLKLWKLQHGIRADGSPNRPLSSFTVEIEGKER